MLAKFIQNLCKRTQQIWIKVFRPQDDSSQGSKEPDIPSSGQSEMGGEVPPNKVSSAEVSECSTSEVLEPSATEDRKDQPPTDSGPTKQETVSGEGHVSTPTETHSPTLSKNGSDEKTDSPPQDIETAFTPQAIDGERASKRTADVDRPSQLDLLGSPPKASSADSESTRDDERATKGHDRKGDNHSSESPTARKEAEGPEPRPAQDSQTGQHSPTQTESGPTNDSESPEPSPEPLPPRAPSDDGGSTFSGEDDTDGHDRKKGGKESTGLKGGKKVEGPEPPPPRQIGRRRNRPMRDAPFERKSFKPRPELICRRPSGSTRWDVILSTDFPIAAVNQNNQPLSLKNGECPLTSFAGQLSVDLMEGPSIKVSLFDKRPLIFKLNKNWTGDGRRVARLTKGHFIVIARVKWVRSGHVPVEPDGCSDSDFKAHYFFRDGSESIKDIGGFAKCEIDTSTPGFELDGKRIFDDSEEGDLFVGPTPQLTPANRVVWARVGEERADGWTGENFKPSESTLAEVLGGRQGRFFVRIYDRETKLVDSGDFRYFPSLDKILVNGEPYSEATLLLPPATGHHQTKVRFIGVDGVPLHPILPPDAVAMANGKDGLIAEPRPDADEISCALEGNGGRVKITLHLPRIWWRMDDDDGETGEWRSKPFKMTRHEFRELAYSYTILRLRLPKRIKSVSVGFGDKLGRKYPKKDDEVALPLDDFVDCKQIDRRFIESALFNVRVGKAALTLIRIQADPTPKIVSFVADPAEIAPGEQTRLQWTTRYVEDVTLDIYPEIGPVEKKGSHKVAPSETTTYTLQLRISGTMYAKQSVKVTLRTALGPRKKLPTKLNHNDDLKGRTCKATIILDKHGQDKSVQNLIEDVKTTLATMDDVYVLKTVDMGRRNLPRVIDANSTDGHCFLLTLKAPTSFAAKVGKKFRLDKILDDRQHNFVILDRPMGKKFHLDKTVYRIMLQS